MFFENFFVIECKLGNKINAITLIHIYTTRISFIYWRFVEIFCIILKFHSKALQLVTFAFYSTLFIVYYLISLAFLLIINFKQYFIILVFP